MMNRMPALKRCPISGKQQYDTWEEANAALREMRKQPIGKKDLRHLNVFQCRECGKFEIGHSHKTDRANARARQAAQPAAPAPKPLTAGQAARQARYEAKEAERHTKRAALFSEYADNLRQSYAMLDREILLTAKAGK